MKVQLLIVDDEEEIREMLSRHFRFLGYEVEVAENGAMALEIMQNRKTDIIISDIRMPVMDGPELCKAVRKDYPMTRMIMMTGYVTLDNALSCLRRGADGLIFKPIEDLTELEDAVKRSLTIIQNWVDTLAKIRGASKKGSPAHTEVSEGGARE
jgi:CheY-like chemotaxis protein